MPWTEPSLALIYRCTLETRQNTFRAYIRNEATLLQSPMWTCRTITCVELQVTRDVLTKYLTQIVSDSTGANEVVGILKKRPSVTQITLSQNALGDEGLQIILQYLTHNSISLSVNSLNLNSCNLGNAALELLGLYLKNQRTLQNLSLQDVRPLSHD